VHKAGFLHGDVHPGNVIRDGSQYYLIDWENARRLSDVTPCSRLMGIPAYLSDEFLFVSEERPYRLSAKDDLIGLAYTLLSLSLGVLPWSNRAPEEIWAARNQFKGKFPQWFEAFKGVLDRPAAPDYTALSACLTGKDPACTVIVKTGRRAGKACGRGLPCQYHGGDPALNSSE